METKYYECDVLIIGSGGAGCRSAIEVSKNNLKPIIVSKGLSFKSGCTGMAEGGYNASFAYVDEDDDIDAHYKDTIKGGGFLNDSVLVKILVNESPDRLIDLENYGALFDRQKNGKLNQRPFGGQSYRRTCFQGDRTGHEMMAALKEEVIRRNIKTMDEIMITSLILDKNNENVQGAIGLSLKDSKILIFKAKSTILALGGAGQLYPVTSNTIQKGGDGFAIAWNAGADLIDMEQVQFHPTGMVFPKSRKGILVTEAVRGEGGVLLNSNKERFMRNYDERMELATRDVVARSIYNEIREGRGTEKGGVYLDVTHLETDLIEEKLETMLLQFMDVGVDIRTDLMEVAPTAHHFMGGVKIDANAKTTIGNLYAAGEVTGGVHGANRLGGNALADTQVFGKIAGESASKNAKNTDINLNQEFIDSEIERISSKFNNGEIQPQKLKKDLQEAMWNYVAIIRDKQGLNLALQEITLIETQIKNTKVSKTKNYNKSLLDILELENMIITAKNVITSAILRQESRGAHYREDFPETKEDWQKSIVLNKKGNIALIPR